MNKEYVKSNPSLFTKIKCYSGRHEWKFPVKLYTDGFCEERFCVNCGDQQIRLGVKWITGKKVDVKLLKPDVLRVLYHENILKITAKLKTLVNKMK